MPDFRQVTETVGTDCSKEQLVRAVSRYSWACKICANKDVLEVACGTGQGLKMIAAVAKSLRASDICDEMIFEAKGSNLVGVPFYCCDEESLPIPENSIDVVICFEAIYYFKNIREFIKETRRILKKSGKLLLSFPNCELYDFNPSPFSVHYFTPREIAALLEENGYRCEFFGGTPLSKIGFRQHIFRPLKSLAARLKWIPGSMHGKKFLKKIVFGKLYKMPRFLEHNPEFVELPEKFELGKKPPHFKVIYCKANL